jgi:mono/diheme cytochrome c family protein
VHRVHRVRQVNRVHRVLQVLLVLGGVVLGARALNAQALPEGPGSEILKARCVSCHQVDLITSQRLSLPGWTREVDKMVRWGATVEASERDPLQAYLASNFAPKPAASHAATGGESVFTRACLSCHGADLVEAQRLSRAGWVREVEKMMRWGAAVGDADKDLLVDYLSGKYGIR